MAPVQVSADGCPRCGGRGWVVQDDEGVGRARRCDCWFDDLTPRLLATAGIPERYRQCRLDGFKTTEPDAARKTQLVAALAASERYVKEFVDLEGGGFRETGLLYMGPSGTGKTHLAAAVLTALIERYRVRGRFVEFTALVHQIQSTFDPRSPESKREVLGPVLDAEVLVVDELGGANPTPWVVDVLYLLVNERYTRRLPTLFTTNYRLDTGGEPAAPPAEAEGGFGDGDVAGREPVRSRGRRGGGTAQTPAPPRTSRAEPLAHRLPAPLVSRLYEMAEPVRLDAAADFRREVRAASIQGAR